MAWLWLILGGLFEVGFTTALRFVEGFRNLPWTLAFLGSVTASMGLLELAARSIPMGTAYAVWGGIGEPAGLLRALLILVIVAAIAGLRLTA
jgi:quaternary ammonium compound-resistance protein SugE